MSAGVDITSLSLEVKSDTVPLASSRLKDLSSSASQAERSAAGMSGGFDSASSSLGRFKGLILSTIAALGLMKLVAIAKECAILAARVETLSVVMKAVGNNAGYTGEQMDGFVKKIKAMGITTQESMNSLIKMAGAQMDLNKAHLLARVAQDAAVIGNVNSSEAFGRMINGIRSGETEILKTLGINVQFEQGYKLLAMTLGKTTEELTTSEKATARMNQVLDYGKNIAGAYEASMGTAGKTLLSMTRFIEELKLKVGQLFTPSLTFAVNEFTRSLKGADEALGKNASKVSVAGEKFHEFLVVIMVGVQQLMMFVDRLGMGFARIGNIAFKTAEIITRAFSLGGNGDWFKQKAKELADLEQYYLDRYQKGDKENQRMVNDLVGVKEGLTPDQEKAEQKRIQASKDALKAQEDEQKRLDAKKLADETAKKVKEDAIQLEKEWIDTQRETKRIIRDLTPAFDDNTLAIIKIQDKYEDLIRKYPKHKDVLVAWMNEERSATLVIQNQSVALKEQSDQLENMMKMKDSYKAYDSAKDVEKLNESSLKIESGLNDDPITRQKNEILARYELERAEVTKTAELHKSNDALQAASARNLSALEKKYILDVAEVEKSASKSKLQSIAMYTTLGSNFFTALASTQDETSRRGFETARAFNLSAAFMSTAAAVMNALATVQPYPAAVIAAGVAAATGAIQIAKISSASFGSGGATSGVESSSGASGMGSGISAPLTSIQDQQTSDQLQRIAGYMESASLAMGKSADSLYDISKSFSGGVGGASFGSAPGSRVRNNYRSAWSQGIEDGKEGIFGKTGPLSGVIPQGSLVGLLGGFIRGGKWQDTNGGFTVGMENGEFSGQEYVEQRKKKSWGRGSRSRTNYSALDQGFSDIISQELGLMIADMRRNSTALGFSGFDSNLAGLNLTPERIQTSGRSAEDILKDVQAQQTRIADAIASTLPGLDQFALFGENISDTLQRLGYSLRDVNDQFALVGIKLLDSTAAGADFAYQLEQLFGGKDSMQKAMDDYFTSMYTSEQQARMSAAAAMRTVVAEFKSFNMEIPTSLDAYNALRNSITDPEMLHALTILGPTFALAISESTRLATTLNENQVSIAETLRDLLTGPLSNINPTDQYNQQREEFQRLQLLAAGGDMDARERISALAQSFLTTSQNYNASGLAYQNDFAMVTRGLADLAAIPSYQELSLNVANAQLEALQAIRLSLTGELGSTSPVPGFAAGGNHLGGLRLVGENGPELEATGPSRITNTNQLRSVMSRGNDELIAEIKALRAEVIELKIHSAAGVRVAQAVGSSLIELGEDQSQNLREIKQSSRKAGNE